MKAVQLITDENGKVIGVPAEELQNSVDTYNACYDAGNGETFGRTGFLRAS